MQPRPSGYALQNSILLLAVCIPITRSYHTHHGAKTVAQKLCTVSAKTICTDCGFGSIMCFRDNLYFIIFIFRIIISISIKTSSPQNKKRNKYIRMERITAKCTSRNRLPPPRLRLLLRRRRQRSRGAPALAASRHTLRGPPAGPCFAAAAICPAHARGIADDRQLAAACACCSAAQLSSAHAQHIDMSARAPRGKMCVRIVQCTRSEAAHEWQWQAAWRLWARRGRAMTCFMSGRSSSLWLQQSAISFLRPQRAAQPLCRPSTAQPRKDRSIDDVPRALQLAAYAAAAGA